jgi:hypothetical protein
MGLEDMTGTMRRVLGAFVMTLAALPFVGGSTATAANPSEDCPDGTTAVAKYEWKGSGYVAEFGGDVVTVTGDTTSGTFTSTVPISAVFVKGAQDGKTDFYDPPVLSGTFTSSGLTNPGGTPAISHVTFCTGGPSTPETTPPTTTSSAPVTTTSSAPVTTTSSAPVTTTSSAPVTTTSSAPASVLPTQATSSEAEETDVAVEGTKTGGELAATGSGLSLGMALATSLGLLLAGAALMFVPRHVAVQRGSHRRRH